MTRGSAWEKLTPSGRVFNAGTWPWICEARFNMFQSSHLSSAFSRLVDVWDMMPHYFGKADPTKFIRRGMREIMLVTTCIIFWIAVLQLKCTWW